MRKTIYNLIKSGEAHERESKIYHFFICTIALLSIVPLMIKGTHPLLDKLDLVTVYILFLDYILRWIAADYSAKKEGNTLSFLFYPFTPYAIIDLFSLLPSLGLISKGWRILRMLRIVKLFRYSKNFSYIANVFVKEKQTLTSVLVIALSYIFISALTMFSFEPDTFDSFFDALYWATTALTTVGYGDVYPTTAIGQFISMISSVFGIAVIALPAGIVTGGFLEEINKRKEKESDDFE